MEEQIDQQLNPPQQVPASMLYQSQLNVHPGMQGNYYQQMPPCQPYQSILRPDGYPTYTSQWPNTFYNNEPTQVVAPLQAPYLPNDAPVYYTSSHWDTNSYLPVGQYAGMYDPTVSAYQLPQSGSFQYVPEGAPVIPKKRSTRRRFLKFCC
ncbi:uncharacterized protein CMU_024250 [Cryptosporidium muris RN66]|uniref:Uncharacterized protein n=1 Tax=Cryptosporidium muris (strain RN66) TaxID=441375 RepID=B6AAL8_CRYMR|nr:uncharacterized protein CMU_024250 [Cryptosporidium muris RN66]EEA05420.1 hypothetical protein, conserved [Cryptosporidium muris RN66]|eukprot:XP_002139769.1 hypothetical protein [Cryptosporidium muris RN66]